jgi:hypothetical protein
MSRPSSASQAALTPSTRRNTAACAARLRVVGQPLRCRGRRPGCLGHRVEEVAWGGPGAAHPPTPDAGALLSRRLFGGRDCPDAGCAEGRCEPLCIRVGWRWPGGFAWAWRRDHEPGRTRPSRGPGRAHQRRSASTTACDRRARRPQAPSSRCRQRARAGADRGGGRGGVEGPAHRRPDGDRPCCGGWGDVGVRLRWDGVPVPGRPPGLSHVAVGADAVWTTADNRSILYRIDPHATD